MENQTSGIFFYHMLSDLKRKKKSLLTFVSDAEAISFNLPVPPLQSPQEPCMPRKTHPVFSKAFIAHFFTI